MHIPDADTIKTFLEFSVPKQFTGKAREVVDWYEGDILAMKLLDHFYRQLPDCREDGIDTIRLLANSQGIFFMAVVTFCGHHYLYLVSAEELRYLGAPAECVNDTELFSFFGLPQTTEPDLFVALIQKAPAYESLVGDSSFCPACLAASGELHAFGCPVEVCPWCAGQLTACGCRFQTLGIDTLSTETHCKNLLEHAEKKGRIPYEPSQRPGYPAKKE